MAQLPQRRLPEWLKTKPDFNAQYRRTVALLKKENLSTVCQEAGCPNRGSCFSCGTATFLILGPVCTRSCGFCGVSKGRAKPPDADEPRRVAVAVQKLGLDYTVLTSVTRDDLPDGGAGSFAASINWIRQLAPPTLVEVLTPDFQGDPTALATIAAARPEVFNHNLETIARLYPEVRPEADYRRSLAVLKRIKELLPQVTTKSGLMVGLGEQPDEVWQVLRDLRMVDCDLLTIGQYLAPSPQHFPVAEYVTPERFEEYRLLALELGFRGVASGPLVRSSYQAREIYLQSRH